MSVNGTSPAVPYERFVQIAQERPDTCAIDQGTRRLTYAELDAAARSARAALVPHQPDCPGVVAILAEDRITSITAILAIAGSHHAYACLDPGDPEQRLRLILADSAPFAILADHDQLERARALAPTGTAVLDMQALPPATNTGLTRVVLAKPDDLLYLFYTSGSTGQPKGVRQTHRNLAFFADAYAATLGIGPQDRLSLLYTLSFSAANMDIYGALLNGATICPRDIRRYGVADLGDWIERERITVLHAVPTVARELSRSLVPGRVLESVRAVDLGGEAVSAADVVRLRDHLPVDCLVVNHLAATEASVIAQYVIPRDVSGDDAALPVGRSPDGVEVRILREDGGEAPTGETGLMAIDSPYLSPGYWRRPEQDATSFRQIAGRPGWRRYIGGDLGFIDTQGLLHFVGRESSRIKLRGQSVDLNEVEAALRSCEGVREAAVVPRGVSGAEYDQLIACLVLEEGLRHDPARLRHCLAQRLPAYMLPGGYCFLEQLPTAATGKLDRRTLEQLDIDDLLYRPDFQPPVGDTEQTIAGMFERVLNFAPVGRRDDFFLLGGDSLTLQALQLEAIQHLGQELPGLHEDATVEGISATLERSAVGKRISPLLTPLRTEGTRPPAFLVHGRLGLAHVSPVFSRLFGQDQPLYAISARGLSGEEAPAESIKEMAHEYVRAIRSVQAHGPYFVCALCAGAYVAMEMTRQIRSAGEEVLPLLLLDPPPPPRKRPRKGRLQYKINEIRHIVETRQGRFDLDIGNPARLEAAGRVAEAFATALRTDRGSAFDGRAIVLVSDGSLAFSHWGNPATRLSVFVGEVYWLRAGETHQDMFDPANQQFADALQKALNSIHTDTWPSNAHSEDIFDDQPPPEGRGHWWRRIRSLLGV